MKLLGWLKGRGWLMVGLVSAALAGAPGCDDAGRKKVDDPDARDMYGVWMDVVEQDEGFAPVYGIWGDVTEDVRPPDLDAELMDAAVYGIWDVGPAETKPEPEVMDMYGVFMDTSTPEDTKAEDDVTAEVYGIWLEDVKE